LFLTQLDQFLLTSGVSEALQSLVQAFALVVGIAIYSVPWSRVLKSRRETA
jgi:ribose transport system permease protein